MKYFKVLREMRLASGLTRREWGQIVGITEATVSRIEAGDTGASVEKISLWCRACDMKISEFFAKTDL